LHRSYGLNPNKVNNSSHDDGITWHSTSVPPTETVALNQLGGNTTEHVEGTAGLRPIDLILTDDGRCNYISPEGKPCARRRLKQDRYQARHWLTCHVMREVDQVQYNQLDFRNAYVIKTEARMRAAIKYKTWCPLCTSTDYFVRDDTLTRHMKNCSGGKVSRSRANRWARENMLFGVGEFSNGYLTAVWRIHHAY
jgi:hypothetical protein